MDMKELISLEEKTKQVVETLSSLEKEVESYQKKNLMINDAFNGLSDLTSTLKNATGDFLSIIELLRKSDFGDALEKVDDRLEKVEILCTRGDDFEKRLTEKQNEIATLVTVSSEATKESIADIQDMLIKIEEKINRIDRNTQKGIGRERG